MNKTYLLLEKILKKNNGYITSKDVFSRKIDSIYFYRFVKENNLLKICPGFYAKNEWPVDALLVFQFRFPKFIFSYDTALFIHNLTDIDPKYIEVTGPKNYRPFSIGSNEAIVHTDTKKQMYLLGIEEKETMFGNKVMVYNKEKTICDLIKNRKRIMPEVFIKAIKRYVKCEDINLPRLYDYSNKLNIELKVRELLEVVLNEN